MGLSTEQIAIAGIVGTLAGTVIGAVIAPWVGGRSDRRLRLLDRRMDGYADLLEVAARLRENAQSRAVHPLAELEDPSEERIRALDARIHVVGSDRVVAATDHFARLSARFLGDLSLAQLRQAKVPEDQMDTPDSLAARMALGEIADEMSAAIKILETTIRDEMKG